MRRRSGARFAREVPDSGLRFARTPSSVRGEFLPPSPPPVLHRSCNICAPMRRADVPEPVLAVCRRLGEAGFQAYVVGGCVRDALRGVPCKDWDVATSADPEIVQRLFRRTI